MAEEVVPRGEAGVLQDVLLRVAGQGHAALLVETVEQHAHLERREVLHLVDGDVAQSQRRAAAVAQRPDAQLPGAQQQRVVLRRELHRRRVLAVEQGEQIAIAAAAPVAARSSSSRLNAPGATRSTTSASSAASAERAAPVVDRLARAVARRSPRAPVSASDASITGCAFRRCTTAGASSRRLARQHREEAAALLAAHSWKVAHPHVPHAERRQHVRDVVAQGAREHDHQRAVAVDRRVVVGQVGDAVQRHRRLARAGGAADHHQAARRLA